MLPNFDPTQTDFTVENAYVLMRASQAAYAPDIESYFGRLKELGIQGADQQWLATTFDAGFLAWTSAFVILCFRGTDNAGGWVSNLLDAFPEDRADYSGKVHRGFADAVDGLWGQFHPWLTNNLNGRPLFLTGHSRGGAITTLAAQKLIGNGIHPTAVYTFGAPRVGNPAFANDYGVVNHYRVENDQDIVPHVPPQPLFQHVGHRFWINSVGDLENKGRAETPLDEKLDLAIKAAAAGTLRHLGPGVLGGFVPQGLLVPEFFSDHASTQYAFLLWRRLPEPARNDAASSPYP